MMEQLRDFKLYFSKTARAVKYIDANTHEKYVVFGDQWTTYAGEVIVGDNNPRAYYFSTSERKGHDLFVNMTLEPSSN